MCLSSNAVPPAERNVTTLEPQLVMHRKWLAALNDMKSADGNGIGMDLFFAARPQVPPEVKTTFPILRHAAWDAALSTGALRLIEYDLNAATSEIYAMQDYLAKTLDRIPVNATTFFDPASRSSSFLQARTALGEVIWVEETLVSLYKGHLPTLRAASR